MRLTHYSANASDAALDGTVSEGGSTAERTRLGLGFKIVGGGGGFSSSEGSGIPCAVSRELAILGG